MLYRLHYFLVIAGASAITILLSVYVKEYTDASTFEIGFLLMLMPFTGIIFRPLICSMADRSQVYQKTLMVLTALTSISYLPFIIIPLLGPQVYQKHARVCWYVLLVSKVFGDITFGGSVSIGDALAVNYAKRVGTKFRTYRIWGTISWITFGIIIGQVNEVHFLPKYVPGFIILCTSFFLDFIIIWLWPAEYFVMQKTNRKKDAIKEKKKNLLPPEVVLAQMKSKILRAVSFGYYKRDLSLHEKKATNLPNVLTIVDGNIVKSLSPKVQGSNVEKNKPTPEDEQLDAKTQCRILIALIRREPRIVLYLLFFVCAGAGLSPWSFFFIYLSDTCHREMTCDFSQLTGIIQVSLAGAELLFFISSDKISKLTGRVNLCAIGMMLLAIKYIYYSTFASGLSPYYSLLVEPLQGIAFGILLTYNVEMGHLFANEVEFILPELIERGLVEGGEAREEKLKMSLSATMQSLITSAQDGIGRGVGSLLFGLFLEVYSFQTIWLFIAVAMSIICLTMFIINLLDRIFNFELGLDVKAAKKTTSPIEKNSDAFGIDLENDSKRIGTIETHLERTSSIRLVV